MLLASARIQCTNIYHEPISVLQRWRKYHHPISMPQSCQSTPNLHVYIFSESFLQVWKDSMSLQEGFLFSIAQTIGLIVKAEALASEQRIAPPDFSADLLCIFFPHLSFHCRLNPFLKYGYRLNPTGRSGCI